MAEKSLANLCGELTAIEKQIQYWISLDYTDNLNAYCNNFPHPFTGLDEDDFYDFKSSIVESLRNYREKKLNTIISACNDAKNTRDIMREA